MPEIVYEFPLAEGTRLSARGGVGTAPIDVNGAQTVSLLFGLGQPHIDINWRLVAGSLSGPVATTNSGTFEAGNVVAITVPVFGPTLSLEVTSQSPQDETIFASVYFIREVP